MDTRGSHLLLAIALAASACTGSIGDSPSDQPPGPGPDGRNPDDPSDPSHELNPEPGVSDLRRLNAREYRFIVADVVGVELPPIELPGDSLNGEGFDTDGATLSMGGRASALYFAAAEAVALEVRRTVRIEAFAPCYGLTHGELWNCFEPQLRPWLRPLFRQPVSDTTVDRLVAIGTELDVDYGSAIETLVTFALTSPYFLIHYKTPDGATAADDHEVASRLALLLWSSAPDDELFALADEGRLSDVEVISAQAERMLDDARAARFIENFARMWIDIEGLSDREGDAEQRALYADLQQETFLFLAEVFRSGRLVDLVRADWTFANRRVAEHYDLPADGLGDEFVRVDLPAERQGLLTHASILTNRSPAGHSDPIRRGFWTAGRLVCNPPPAGLAPPAVIEPLQRGDGEITVRDVLAEHRENPYCAGCHDYTDPYGLAMETFDLNGKFRPIYEGGQPVDPSGRLPSGEEFADVYELADVVATRGDVQRCVSRYLTGYALGRGLTGGDTATARQDLEAFVAARGMDSEALTLRDLIVRLVSSGQFRNNEGGGR